MQVSMYEVTAIRRAPHPDPLTLYQFGVFSELIRPNHDRTPAREDERKRWITIWGI